MTRHFYKPTYWRRCSRLAEAGQDAVICRSSRGLEPLPGVYSCRLLQRLQAQVIQGDDLRLRTLLNACRTKILSPEEVNPLDPHELSFLNINTAEDAARAAKWLSLNCAQSSNRLLKNVFSVILNEVKDLY